MKLPSKTNITPLVFALSVVNSVSTRPLSWPPHAKVGRSAGASGRAHVQRRLRIGSQGIGQLAVYHDRNRLHVAAAKGSDPDRPARIKRASREQTNPNIRSNWRRSPSRGFAAGAAGFSRLATVRV